MKNTTRRVLILKNVNSELIEQAILILKDSAPEGDSAVIREAEKVVEKYMDKSAQKVRKEKEIKKALTLYLSAMFVGIGILIFTFFV